MGTFAHSLMTTLMSTASLILTVIFGIALVFMFTKLSKQQTAGTGLPTLVAGANNFLVVIIGAFAILITIAAWKVAGKMSPMFAIELIIQVLGIIASIVIHNKVKNSDTANIANVNASIAAARESRKERAVEQRVKNIQAEDKLIDAKASHAIHQKLADAKVKAVSDAADMVVTVNKEGMDAAVRSASMPSIEKKETAVIDVDYREVKAPEEDMILTKIKSMSDAGLIESIVSGANKLDLSVDNLDDDAVVKKVLDYVPSAYFEAVPNELSDKQKAAYVIERLTGEGAA